MSNAFYPHNLVKEEYISFADLDPFKARVILHESFQCIKIASRFGGKVFGGFVRDVVCPFSRQIAIPLSFKDIDLWFKTKEQADNFRNAMGDTLVDAFGDTTRPSLGNFSRHNCFIRKYNVHLILVDVIVSGVLPVDDFDVNTVTYSLTEDDKWITDSPEYLLKQIEDKEATILPTYVERIKISNTGKSTQKAEYFKKRIDRMFLNKGWKVCDREQIWFKFNEAKNQYMFDLVENGPPNTGKPRFTAEMYR